jgi:chromosome segregation ATPase
MSVNLKREFLSLLEKDTEFRYAVAGYLGLSEILKKMDALIEEQHRLWENQNRLWENQNKMWEEIKALREGQNKLWEEVKALREGQNKLWEEVRSLREGQNKLWEDVRTLREDVGTLKEDVRTLKEDVRTLKEDVGTLKNEQKSMRVMLERLTLSVEDEARDVISYRLRRELGIDVRLDRIFVNEREINIYGVSGEVCVVGEATVRLGVSLVEELEEKIELIRKERPELLKPKLIKVIYADYSVTRALELASNYNIWVLNWKGDLTPRKIIQ